MPVPISAKFIHCSGQEGHSSFCVKTNRSSATPRGEFLASQLALMCLWVPTMSEMKATLVASGFEIFKSTFFYDPPIEARHKTPGDWVFGSVKQLLWALYLGLNC